MQIRLDLLHNLAQSKARFFAGRSSRMRRGAVHDVLHCELVLGVPGQDAIPHPTPLAMSPSPWAGIPTPAALGIHCGAPHVPWVLAQGHSALHAPPCITVPCCHGQAPTQAGNKVCICNLPWPAPTQAGNTVCVSNRQLMVRVINHSSRLARDVMDFLIPTPLNHHQFSPSRTAGAEPEGMGCITQSNLPPNWCCGWGEGSSRRRSPSCTGALIACS